MASRWGPGWPSAWRQRGGPRRSFSNHPFTSAVDVARRTYWFLPVSLLMKDQFRSIALAPRVAIPAFVFHGTADQVVPFAQGEAIYAALGGPKAFHAIAGGTHVAPLTAPLWDLMQGFIKRYAAPAR